jgi:hypothetical protein
MNDLIVTDSKSEGTSSSKLSASKFANEAREADVGELKPLVLVLTCNERLS